MKPILTASAIVLSATLAAASMQASADFAVGGDETNVDRNVPFANAWTILVSEPFVTATGSHCIATGSADALNPLMGDDNLYRFVLTIDNVNPNVVNSACERSVEFDVNGADTQRIEEVSSTCTFRNIPPGFHRISWLARKGAAAAPNLTVDDNSMTFVCQNNLLDGDGLGDGGAW